MNTTENQTDESDALREEGYNTALDDVRAAIDESLNLAHLREALRYLRYSPGKAASS